MHTLDAIVARRATKKFDTEQTLTPDEQKALLKIALDYAPSAFNLQHWRPLLVLDREQREAIRENAWNQSQVTDAAMLVVLCGDMASWKNHIDEIWQDADPKAREFMSVAIDNYYRDKPDIQRDEVMRSAGIFTQTLMLAAKAQGYDSCPMDGFDYHAVGKLVNKPEHYRVCLMIAIGKAAAAPHPRIGKLGMDQTVAIDRF